MQSHAARCSGWPLRGSCTVAKGRSLRGGFGPRAPPLPLRCHILHPLLKQQCHLLCSELEPLAIRDSLGCHRVFRAARVDPSDAELLAPGAELAAVIGGGKPEGLRQRLEPKPLGIESAAIRQGDRDAEGGIEPSAQIDAGYVARLDHKAMTGCDRLAGLQHLGLQPLAQHGRQVSRGLGAGHGSFAIGSVPTGLPHGRTPIKRWVQMLACLRLLPVPRAGPVRPTPCSSCPELPPARNSTFRLYSGPGPVVRLDSGAGLRLCRRARRRDGWSRD